MPVLLILAALFAMLAFLIWERRRSAARPVTPLPRAALRQGWQPRPMFMWKASAALGAMSGLVALVEWHQPGSPPFTGRWAGVMAFLHTQFGVHGAAYFWAAWAAALLVIAWLQYLTGAQAGADRPRG